MEELIERQRNIEKLNKKDKKFVLSLMKAHVRLWAYAEEYQRDGDGDIDTYWSDMGHDIHNMLLNVIGVPKRIDRTPFWETLNRVKDPKDCRKALNKIYKLLKKYEPEGVLDVEKIRRVLCLKESKK